MPKSQPDTELVTIAVTCEVYRNATAEQLDDSWDDFMCSLVEQFEALKEKASTTDQ